MRGTSQRWVVGAACGLGILLVTAPKPVQAIDCQKAATNVEHAICRDTGVYALDRELTQALHRVLESHPARVGAKTLNTSEDSCDGADCEDMRKAAFELVKAKIAGTGTAESLLRGLTAQQRERYQAEQSAAEGQPDAGASENVVFVPYVRQGEVYVARIADRTIGWRVYADQSVKFERLEDGKITEKVAFAVGVWKGELENAGVESTEEH